VLAGVVGGTVGDAPQPGDGGDVDDRPGARPEHHPAERLAQQERAGQVHLQHPPPLRRRGVLGRRQQRDAGVVDQDVDPAEPLPHPCGQRGDPGVVGDVTGDAEGLDAALAGGGHHRGGLAQVQQGERVPLVRERLGHPPADALRDAGDHGNRCRRTHRQLLLPRPCPQALPPGWPRTKRPPAP
jgi:hypothetical protein